MMWLHKEHETFKNHYEKKVSDEAAEIIVYKLARHFRIGKIHLRFFGNRQSGAAWPGWRNLRLSHNPSLGLIAHELVHLLKKNCRHGSKLWNRTMQRILNYGDKKNWWEEEITKRIAPKVNTKPEPTKNEIQDIKIQKAQEKIERYEKKIKFYTNKLSKARRSLAMLMRYQKKMGEPENGVII
jgi:hypothetical protein